MRKGLTAFLILSLLGGQVGMLGALIGRHRARRQMRHRINAASESPSTKADVQHLTISRAERQSTGSSFVRIEDGEFRYQGTLYDVVHDEWRGRVWHVWVIHDREEEQYLDALAQVTNTPVLEGSTVPVQQRRVGHRPIALIPSALSSPPSPPLRSQFFPRFSSPDHQAPYLEVPHPPPWG